MKIVNAVLDDANVYGYYEEGGRYYEFHLSKDGRLGIWPVNMDFRDYEHFVGVFGKFNPYTRFLAQPVEVARITKESLLPLAERL